MNRVEENIQECGTQQSGPVLLFVCTGNTCRSPMAAAVYNAVYASRDGSRAFSAGLAADGSPISRHAAAALSDAGIVSCGENSYMWHTSHTVTETDLEKADMVIGITGRHAMELLLSYPAYAGKITALPMDITDPFLGDMAVYRECLQKICEALAIMFDEKDPTSIGEQGTV